MIKHDTERLNLHPINYKRLGIMMPVIVAGVIALILLTNAQTHATVVKEGTNVHINSWTDPVSEFNQGHTLHLIKQLDSSNHTIYIKRGTTQNIPIVLMHLSRVPGESITLTNFQIGNRIFAPGSATGLTDEQFDEKIARGDPISGEIPIKGYVTISPPSVTIPANSSATINLQVSIPTNYPDSMLNNELILGFGYDSNIPYPKEWSRGISETVEVEP